MAVYLHDDFATGRPDSDVQSQGKKPAFIAQQPDSRIAACVLEQDFLSSVFAVAIDYENLDSIRRIIVLDHGIEAA
jgi:hypothetical protein